MRDLQRPAPVDKKTLLPKPIYSVEGGPTNWHHIWFEDWLYTPSRRNSKVSEYAAGLAVLRLSAMHEVSALDHKRYHRRFDGVMPPPPDRLITTLILSLAAYLPVDGLVIMPGGHIETVMLDNAFLEDVRKQDKIQLEKEAPIKKYLTTIAVRHGVGGVDAALIERFVGMRDGVRRQECAAEVLRLAGGIVVDSARADYVLAHQMQALSPGSPPEIETFIGDFISPEGRLRDQHTLHMMHSCAKEALRAA